MLLVLICAGWAAHVASIRAPFVFDDGICIRENASIVTLSDWGKVLWPPVNGSGVSGRPLVNLSLALNYAWGEFDPFGYHAFNLFFHLWVGALVFSVTSRCLRRALHGNGYSESTAQWVAFVVALSWVVHPLQTESVACVIQRTEILGGFFYLLTLWAFVRGVESSRAGWWWWGSVMACLAGMAAKEILFTAPLLVLLLDRSLWAGTFRDAWRLRARFYLGLASTWLLLAWILYRMGGTRGNAAGFGTGVITWWSYFLKQWEAISTYLKLVVWPNPLVIDYGCSVIWDVGQVAGRGALLFALGGMTVLGVVRNRRWALLGAAFFLILGPSSSVMPLSGQTMAEHRMYLPLIAVLLLLALAGWRVLGRRALWALPLLVASLVTLSVARNRAYQVPLNLWLEVVRERPDNIRAYYNAGDAWFDLGRWDEASAFYSAALKIDPNYTGAWSGLGNVALRRRDFAEAIRCYERAIALDPDYIDSISNLGAALWAVGRKEEGLAQLRRLIQLRPDFANAHFNLGTALLMAGDWPAARQSFAQAIRLRPTHAEAHHNLGVVFLQSGSPREAEECFLRALQLRPDYPDAVQNLAIARARRP